MKERRTKSSISRPTWIMTNVAAFAAAGVLSVSLAQAQPSLAEMFDEICLDTLPGFVNAPEVLQAMGYDLYRYGDSEYEFAHPEFGFSGALAVATTGGPTPGCTVMDDASSREQAMDDAKVLMETRFGVAPELWSYGGEPSGWTAPYEGRVLYVLVAGGGNSGEGAGGGLSAEIRDQ